MKALNVIPAPFSSYVYFHGDVMHFYGAERTKHMFPMRSFLDTGLRPTDASDYTASPADPMMWLRSQLTRMDMKGNVWGGNQRITLEEALRCGTINGAYASFEENIKGTLEPGKLADLVVLTKDPFKTRSHRRLRKFPWNAPWPVASGCTNRNQSARYTWLSGDGRCMKYRDLGRTGWKVSEISFGAWAIGGAWGNVPESDALGALNQAIDSGVNFIDTADVTAEAAANA